MKRFLVTLVFAASFAQAGSEAYPEFSWDTVPIAFHFGKSDGLMTEQEARFVTERSNFICLEKAHGIGELDTTEAGIEAEAFRLKKLNPKMKVIFYWNTFLDYSMYEAHDVYAQRPEWWLHQLDGELDLKNGRMMRYDLSNSEFRDWWTDVAAKAVVEGSSDGVFMDALPQVVAERNRALWGDEKFEAIQQGLEDIIRETREKIGEDNLIVYNGIRSTPNWGMGFVFPEYTDAAMIEHFGDFQSGTKEMMLRDILEMEQGGKDGKIVVMKGWAGFTFIDRDAMAKPLAEKQRIANESLLFPLACFLAGAQENCYFIYNWGYRMNTGALEWYPEFDKPLGEPLNDMVQEGWELSREYTHASVRVDLEFKEAEILWR